MEGAVVGPPQLIAAKKRVATQGVCHRHRMPGILHEARMVVAARLEQRRCQWLQRVVRLASVLLVGYFEGIDSERRIACRTADSLAARSLVRDTMTARWLLLPFGC